MADAAPVPAAAPAPVTPDAPAAPVKVDPPAGDAPAAEPKVEAKTETPNEARLRKLAISAQRDREAANAMKGETEAAKARAAKLDEFKTTAKPNAWLKENLGVDMSDLLRRASAEELGSTVEPTADERLKKIEDDRAAEVTASLAAQEKQVRAAVKEQISSRVVIPGDTETWADKYELINAYGAHDDVYDKVDAYCKANPGMSRDEVNAAYLEAADEKEAELEAKYIEPATKTKKFAKRFAGRPATEKPATSEPAKAGTEAPKQTGDEKTKPSTTTLTGLGRSTPTNPKLPPNLSKTDSAKRIRQIAAWNREQGIAS